MQTTASTLFILAKNPNLKPRRLKTQGDYYYTSAQPDQPKAALIDNKITVYIGTGRYLQVDPTDPANPLKNDLINTVVQSFYSIIDESDDPAKQGTVPRNKLLPQTITQTNAPIGPYSASRTVSDNKLTDPAYSDRDKGCYMDFTTTPGDPSERITSGVLIKTFTTPSLEARVIFVTSTPTKGTL